MSIVITRATKQAARYTDAGGRERCSACRFFMPQGTCGRIIGPVSPRGWCRFYSQEAVQRWQPQGAQGQGGSPSLDLSFISGSGVLDPRITFTRASTATYFNSTGVMQTAAINAPRFDYDPVTHALRGLLIEDTRTNVVGFSANFGTGWAAGNVTVTTGIAGAPDGTASMSRLAETATATVFHYVVQLPTVAASQRYTMSVYAKAAEVRYLQIAMDDGGTPNGGYATFDLQAGVVSGPPTAVNGGTVGAATIQPVGNGIYRCAVAVTIGALTSGRCWYVLSNVPTPGFLPTYTGNPANGLQIWGGQVEQGAFPTSYIPTTAAAVTRSADLCSISSANMSPWFVSPGGSWFAEFINSNPLADRSSRIIGIHDGTALTPMWLPTTTPVLSAYDGSQIVTVNAAVSGAVSKGASTWAPGTGRVCLNGGAIGTGSMTTGFATLATVGVGILGGNPGVPNESMTGYIRRVRYWPRVLSDAEMQQVTT